MELAKIIDGLIRLHIRPLNQKLNAAMIAELSGASHRWVMELLPSSMNKIGLLKRLTEFLGHFITESQQEIIGLKTLYGEFNRRFTDAASEKERQEHILTFSEQLGASEKALKRDQKAFSRWFGADTVTQRYQKKVNWLERKIAFALDRLGTLSEELLYLVKEPGHFKKTYKQLPIEKVIKPLLDYDGDSRVRIEAFRCLSRTLQVIPRQLIRQSMDETMVKFVFRAALDRKQQIWIQCEALKLLESLSVASMGDAITHRLTRPLMGDDIFVRGKAVALLCANLKRVPQMAALLEQCVHDPSPFVRQHLIRSLKKSIDEKTIDYLTHFVLNDPAKEVRSVALIEIEAFLQRGESKKRMLDILLMSLKEEKDDFVKHVGIVVAQKGLLIILGKNGHTFAFRWFRKVSEVLFNLIENDENIPTRRWAKQAVEYMWTEIDLKARELKAFLSPIVYKIALGKQRRIPASVLKTFGEITFGRVLSVICQNDYPVGIKTGLYSVTLYRGHLFKFRLWRFLHEFLRPSPDKRQAFSHTTGRHFKGNLQFPSTVLSELAPTKVPGEPLFMPEEAGFRPYLPLVDELISYANPFSFGNNSYKIYTSQGITRISGPRSFLFRAIVQLRLAINFSRLSALRNWDASGQELPSAYVEALEDLGFRIFFEPYSENNNQKVMDRSVTRFFSRESVN